MNTSYGFLKGLSAALLLALLLTASSCTIPTGTNNNKSEPNSSGENTPSALLPSQTPSKGEESSPSGAPPVSDETPTPSGNEEQLAVNKTNALEKLNSGYTATMGCSALRLEGTVSNYTAGAGKGDTVSYPISFVCNKSNEIFKAMLSYEGSSNNTKCYFEGSKKYTELTDTENGESSVTAENSSAQYSISTSVMPVFSENLTITSYENAFKRFCDTDFGVELKDGIYTLYFYGSYTELARICLEDSAYESFVARDVESQFKTAASMEIFLNEDGYYVGMRTEINLESPQQSMKNTLSYTFSDFNQPQTVNKPDFASKVE